MAWTDLKAAVAAVIKTNGNQEITGSLLQSTLNSIIDQVGANATYKGVATPTTVPGTPDGIVFYIASTEGTYSNFAGYVHNGDKLVILTNTAGAWTATELDVLTSVSATARTFAAAVLTNPFTAGKSPRRIGDFAINTTSGEIWQATAITNAAASWNCISAGYYDGRIITNWDTHTQSGDMTSYGTATGAPTSTESFYGHHINSNAGVLNAFQFAIGYTTLKMYFRAKTASTWGAWSVGITSTELGYLAGVTSNIQSQMDAKADQTELDQLAGEVSVKMTNLLQNSSFENGVIAPIVRTDSLGAVSTLSINTINPISGNYDARLEMTTAGTSSSRPILNLNGSQNEWVLNHIFYFGMSVKVNSGTPVIYSAHNGVGVDVLNLTLKDGLNSWTVKCLGLIATFAATYLDGRTLWDFNFDNLIAYDLTAIFGEGNEPTKEEMDLLISTLGTDYFEGEITISAQKVMQWQLANMAQTKLTYDGKFTQVESDIEQLAVKSEYPYENGFLFSASVLNAGIDKWLIDAYFDWNSEEGFRYSFSIISKTDLTARLYKHVDGQPASGNITFLGLYTFVKIPGSKYYKGTLSAKPNDWIIADFDAMTVESEGNMFYTDGVGLSPRLFKNGIQSPIPFDEETMTISNAKITDISYIHSDGLSIYEGNAVYSQVVMGTYLAPQGHKLLIRRIKTKIYCGNSTVPITARVYKSKTLHQDPTNDKTLIEEVVFEAGTFKNVAAGFQEIVLSQDAILDTDDYLYLYVDGGAVKVTLPRWDRTELGQPEEPLTSMIFKLGVEGNYYFSSGLDFLSTPLLLLSSESDTLSNQVADHEERIETLETSIPLNSPIEISLPDTIYAIAGDQLQLFYRGMIAHPYPYIYDILPTCSKGKNYPRYFYYLPTVEDVGTTTFKVEVKDKDGNILGSKTCNLVTKAAVQAPATDKKVLCVGDSLTNVGTWCIEASRRLIGTGGTPVGRGLTNISFLGRKTGSGIGWEGNGGWTWDTYIGAGVGVEAYKFYVSGVETAPSMGATYTNNGNTYTIFEINITAGTGYVSATGTGTPTASGTLTKVTGGGDATLTFSSSEATAGNPFWDADTNSLDFPRYVNTYMGGACDIIYFLITWNGQTPHRTDFTSMINSAKVLVDHIHTNYPNCKMKIMGPQVPSLNGGMGANYGAKGIGYADPYGMVVTALNMNKVYQDWCNEAAYSSFLEFVNISSQFDSENNMPEGDAFVNVRSTKTEKLGTNGVHPATAGYYQIGDVVFRNFIANFCQ